VVQFGSDNLKCQQYAARLVERMKLPQDNAAGAQKRPATDAQTGNKRAKTGPDRQQADGAKLARVDGSAGRG
jgi:hypothetical protein